MELIEGIRTDIDAWNTRVDQCIEEYGKEYWERHGAARLEPSENDPLFVPWDGVAACENNRKYFDFPETRERFGGVYMVHRQSAYDWMRDYVEDDRFLHTPHSWEMFGVADNASQVLDFFEEYERENGVDFGKCIISMLPILRQHEPPSGGWRWHKWGQYIGKHDHCHEYLAHEDEDIHAVYCFHLHTLAPRTKDILETIEEFRKAREAK